MSRFNISIIAKIGNTIQAKAIKNIIVAERLVGLLIKNIIHSRFAI